MKYIFFVSLPLYLLDRITKYWVLHSIDPDQPVVVVPGFFHLVNVTNTGAAFGSFKNNNAFFIAISGVALLFALVLLLGDTTTARQIVRNRCGGHGISGAICRWRCYLPACSEI